MEEESDYGWVSWLEVILFVLLLYLFFSTAITGSAWEILSQPEFSYWLNLLTFLLAISAGWVSTYSFVSFAQDREIRSFMLILLGANIILWSFLFLVTHPSSAEWSTVFATRERNRTLAMALVLIVVPTILLGSFTGDAKPKRPSVFLLLLWGAVIMPAISLWFFFSTDPVFLMTSPEGGVEGLTPVGMVISMGYLIAQIVALIRFAHKWWKTRNILDLSLLLALGLWITGTIFVIILWDPFQVAELIWMATNIAGFLLIAVVHFITSIIQPHRALEGLVEQRTRELELSKKESEFYLNMWTHKMGNILQGVVTYLDILEAAAQHGEDDRKTRVVARDISRDATLVNHQVLQLTQIKDSLHQSLKPVGISDAITKAIKSAIRLLGEDTFAVEFTQQRTPMVLGDDLLDLAFQSAIFLSMKNRLEEVPTMTISIDQTDDTYTISIKSRGKPMPREAQEFLKSETLVGNIALDLDLFTIKLLMSRYDGQIECLRNDTTEENTCVFSFDIYGS